MHGFEEVVGGVAHDHCRCGTEVAREVSDGHAGAVDLAIVACKEEVHVRAVADDCLVDCTGGGARDRAREEWLCCSPSIGIRGVGRGPVRERGGTPLICENPNALGCEVEDCWCYRAGAHSVLAGGSHVGPVVEETEDHGAVGCSCVVGCGINKMLAIVESG